MIYIVHSYNVSIYNISDIDECKSRPHDCDQKCNNTVGSYHCECNEGYTIALEDQKKCEGWLVSNTL